MSDASIPLAPGLRIRLSAMMFIQFFIWGAWYVTLGTWLGKGLSFSGGDIGAAYSTIPWGAIIAPLVVGMIADRFFAAQRVLGVLHLAGAGLLFWASTITDARALFWVLLAYAFTFMPTLALANVVAFSQLSSIERQFPAVRVFGTLGWIVAGVLVGTMGIEASPMPMRLAAVAAAALGVYAFTLPHTPPRAAGRAVSVRDVLGLDALALMRDRSFATLVVGSLLICIPLAFYYNFTNLFLNDRGVVNAASKMTLGQGSEVALMLVMPFMFLRLGVKWMLIIGMLAWAVRYALFACGNAQEMVWMFYGGILLHGICYDFFFVTGQIHVDNTAPSAVRASAQGFIALVTYGVGMLIGAWIAGAVVDACTTAVAGTGARTYDWFHIWLVPAAMSVVVAVAFAVLFKAPARKG